MRSLVILVVLCGCWQSSRPAAQTTTPLPPERVDPATRAYDADIEVVYQAAYDAIHETYSTLEEDAMTRTIKSAWHQIVPPGGKVTDRRYFARFDISIQAPRPYVVAIEAHLAEWDVSQTVPLELTGPIEREWLDEPVAKIHGAIYARLEEHAR